MIQELSEMSIRGWIGVDLDGTLAHYDEWVGVDHIGEPIPEMVERVKTWLAEGKDVRIFTARICGGLTEGRKAANYIEDWCAIHIGTTLPITCMKDFQMIELWDDRCVHVEKNTGRILG